MTTTRKSETRAAFVFESITLSWVISCVFFERLFFRGS